MTQAELFQTGTTGSTTKNVVTILCVEDDYVYLSYIRATLRAAEEKTNIRFDLISAATLEESYALVDKADLILLDLMLPDSNGLKTFEHMSVKSPTTPIIVLTVWTDENQGFEAVRLGAQDYLVKSKIAGESLVRCILYTLARLEVAEYKQRLRAINDFSSALAHDLQTPLVGAGLVLDKMLEHAPGQVPDYVIESLHVLRKSNEQISQKVKTLLDIYRLESHHHSHLVMSEVDLNPVLAECVEACSTLQYAQKVTINNEIESELLVRGNRELLKQLFSNLLNNAIKFSQSGSDIRINARIQSELITIDIIDHGIGIGEEDLRLLFKKFWRGGNGGKYTAGTGLGLYLCKQIAFAHDATMNAQSELGKGSTFSTVFKSASRTIGN